MTCCTHVSPLQKAFTDQKKEEVAFEWPCQIADLLNTDVVARQFTGKPSRVSEFQQFCDFAKIPLKAGRLLIAITPASVFSVCKTAFSVCA